VRRVVTVTRAGSSRRRYPAQVTDPDVLRAVRFFDGLDAPVVAALAKEADEVSVAAGELIIEQGEDAGDVYFLLEGSLEALLRFEGVGDLFMGTHEGVGTMLGWSAFRPPYRYTDSVRSHRPSRLLRVPRATFETTFAADPAVAHELLRRVNVEVAEQVETTRCLIENPQVQAQEL
jgi:CRP-like cAMP-binding protein